MRMENALYIWRTYQLRPAVRETSGWSTLFIQSAEFIVAAGSSIDALPYRDQGLAGRVTYSYDDRYFIEGNFGYNGSENFASGNRFGFFPAGAIGWIVSNEKSWVV